VEVRPRQPLLLLGRVLRLLSHRHVQA
jgi:hypothetical protein